MDKIHGSTQFLLYFVTITSNFQQTFYLFIDKIYKMSVPSKSSHTIDFNENNNNQATKKEDHEVTRKYCCWSQSCFTIWNVKQSVTEGGNEKMIELNVVAESLR